MPTWRTPGSVSSAHDLVEAGRGDRADRRAHLGAEAAGGDQDHPLGALGELVGELHRDAAAEAVADDGDLVDAEQGEQVAHAVGVAADAVVGAGLRRQSVAEQVGRDDGVAAGQRVDHRLPRGVVAAEAVQQENGGTGADLDVRAAVAVQRDVLDLMCGRMLRRHWFPHSPCPLGRQRSNHIGQANDTTT